MDLPLGAIDFSRGDQDLWIRWNRAYRMVSDYLRAYRVDNILLLHQTALQVIYQLKTRIPDPAAVDEAELMKMATLEVDEYVNKWLAAVLGEDAVCGKSSLVRGRLALVLCGFPEKWGTHFLSPGPLPPEFVQQMRKAHLVTGPGLKVTSMRPEPIDMGVLTDAARSTWEVLDRWPWLKALMFWSVLLGMTLLVFSIARG
jgi:hypothetical protein